MRQVILLVVAVAAAYGHAAVSPNDMPGATDAERINAAVARAAATGDEAVIPRRNARTGGDIWLIDRAILLPSNSRLVLDDCLVRLSPGTQDNILRNAGATLSPRQGNTNITVIGRGNAVLSGGTGPHFDPPGDRCGWRTIGILLYNTRHFELSGFTIEEPQCWGVSMENGCAYGRVGDIRFSNSNRIPNQDGVDVRKGCHHILIENISGMTGDDTVAMTGLRLPIAGGGAGRPDRKPLQIGDDTPAESDDIHHITVRNIRTYVSGGHSTVRILNHDGIRVHDIAISDIYDISEPGQVRARNGILLGEKAEWNRYFTVSRNRFGETYNIFVTNVNSRAQQAVYVGTTLSNAVFRGIHALDKETKLFTFDNHEVDEIVVE